MGHSRPSQYPPPPRTIRREQQTDPRYIQSQTGTKGLESKMEPAANWTQMECYDDEGKPYLKEYEGRGLLQDKAVLITGGDSGIGRSVAILMSVSLFSSPSASTHSEPS